MKFVIAFLLTCSSVLAQGLTEPPLNVMTPIPDPIGNMNSDVPLNQRVECCDIWFQRKLAREEWEQLDTRLDELIGEYMQLSQFETFVMADLDLTEEGREMILRKINENQLRKLDEKVYIEGRMAELEGFIHECNDQWLILGCGFYPFI